MHLSKMFSSNGPIIISINACKLIFINQYLCIWSEMGQGWNAAIFHHYDDVKYIKNTQNGFSDHKNYNIGGITHINPGQAFPYRNNYIKNYHRMLSFFLFSLF